MDLQLIGMEVNSDFLEQYSVLRVSLFCDHVCVYIYICVLSTAYYLVIDFQLFLIKLTVITFI